MKIQHYLLAIIIIASSVTLAQCQQSTPTSCSETSEVSIYMVVAYKKAEISDYAKQVSRKKKGKSFSAFIDFSKQTFFVQGSSLTATSIENEFNRLLTNNRSEVFLQSRQRDIDRLNSEFCQENQLESVLWPDFHSEKYYVINNDASLRDYCFQIYHLKGSWITLEIKNKVPENRFWSFSSMGLKNDLETIDMHVLKRIKTHTNTPDLTGGIELWKEVSSMWGS